MGITESYNYSNHFGWPDNCEQCGKSLVGHRFVKICNQCVEINKETELSLKLDDISWRYTTDQRIRAIERFILSGGGTLKHE